MASDTDHRAAYDSHLHSDVFFISQSAVAGMEDLGDYMIRIDNTDSAPITFNMNPSVLFPELSDQLQLTKNFFSPKDSW